MRGRAAAAHPDQPLRGQLRLRRADARPPAGRGSRRRSLHRQSQRQPRRHRRYLQRRSQRRGAHAAPRARIRRDARLGRRRRPVCGHCSRRPAPASRCERDRDTRLRVRRFRARPRAARPRRRLVRGSDPPAARRSAADAAALRRRHGLRARAHVGALARALPALGGDRARPVGRHDRRRTAPGAGRMVRRRRRDRAAAAAGRCRVLAAAAGALARPRDRSSRTGPVPCARRV